MDIKQKLYLLMILIVVLLFCTACQKSRFLEEVIQTLETSQQEHSKGIETLIETTSSAQTDIQIGTNIESCTYSHYIEEMDVTLKIPEELYVYQIDGVYLDWSGNLKVHDFSKWIIITDIQYREESIANTLINCYNEEAEHIIFGLAITSEELFPVRRLCFSVYASGPFRVINNGYCEILNSSSRLEMDGWLGGYKGISDDEKKEKWGTWLDIWTESVENHSFPAVHLCKTSDLTLTPVQNFVEGEDLYDETMVNDELWELYVRAVNELKTFPEKYDYDEEVTLSLMEEINAFFEVLKKSSPVHQETSLVSMYADSEQDIYIRAYNYARYVVRKYSDMENPLNEVSINNIVVIMQNWQNGQSSYNVYLRGEDSEYKEISAGYNCFTDLQRAYTYITENSER